MNHDDRSEAPLALGELAELAARDPERLSEHLRDLSPARIADLALRLEPERRLELLLHGPQPMRAVRALPDSEFYLTVREVGPTDALPLVALASTAQLLHLLDLEGWRRDRFDAARAGAWIALLLEAGEPAVRRVLRAVDDDVLTLLVARWLGARPLEASDEIETYGREQTEAGDELGPISPDGYYRLSPAIPEQLRAVQGVARVLYLDQPDRYRRVMWEAAYGLPAEIEEAALHWRASRLEEHGYPPWDEAMSIYGPPANDDAVATPPTPVDRDGLPASRLPLRVLDGDDELLAAALDGLAPDTRERAMHELVSLANRILIADGLDTGLPDAHRAALRVGAGYVRVGLERAGALDPDAARDGLERRPALEWFRRGFELAAGLRDEARRMLGPAGWGRGHDAAAELLDEPLAGRIAALLEARPLYVELDDEGRARRRPFARLAEVDETRAALTVADAVGALLVERFGLDPGAILERAEATHSDPPPFSTAWLTLLAWFAVRGELRGDPLPAEVLVPFVRDVASRRSADAGAAREATDRLLGRMRAGGAIDDARRAAIDGFAHACLARLDAALGELEPGADASAAAADCLLLEPA